MTFGFVCLVGLPFSFTGFICLHLDYVALPADLFTCVFFNFLRMDPNSIPMASSSQNTSPTMHPAEVSQIQPISFQQAFQTTRTELPSHNLIRIMSSP
ncbi:hypothetical protein AMELA_G00178630 [Ameiurus melas]|uniref:Uncharacterized protein n=1 Tax=Ameiurus melas TaxID=219545 RepID=A0A7J6A9F4_AMEME|nr:hypothetical protein AMELA_G00178630 [Ameiurus melas]